MVKFILDNGKKVKWMDMGNIHGQVVIVTKANIDKIKWKGKVYIFIIMEKLIQVN
jgi:hypothetical protein